MYSLVSAESQHLGQEAVLFCTTTVSLKRLIVQQIKYCLLNTAVQLERPSHIHIHAVSVVSWALLNFEHNCCHRKDVCGVFCAIIRHSTVCHSVIPIESLSGELFKYFIHFILPYLASILYKISWTIHAQRWHAILLFCACAIIRAASD